MSSPRAALPSLRTALEPLVAGLVAVVGVWVAWGAISPHPAWEDEDSYLLQARIFASGHWTAPAPPLPAFFQQPYVLTTPVLASKYPPGHAILLAVGALAGFAPLVPLLLTAVTGALIFVLARRLAGARVAGLTVLIWLSDPLNLHWRTSYFSELTTAAAWVVAWWALVRWRDGRQARWLVVVAIAVAWGCITRELTMLAFALPVAVVVARDVIRLERWKDLAIAAAAGAVILSIYPLWSAETTGDWRVSPRALYSRDYQPFDHPGFGADSTPPAIALNPVNQFVYDGFFAVHADHTLAALPRIAAQRLGAIAAEEWSGARLVIVPFVLIGLASLSAETAFGVICAAVLFLTYLTYAHPAAWTLYYAEAAPVPAILGAIGIDRVLRRIRAPHVASAVVAALVLAGLAMLEIGRSREAHAPAAAYDARLAEATTRELARLPAPSAVFFVHYSPGFHSHTNAVQNAPHMDRQPVWFVNDLGDRDSSLMRYAGDRTPVDFDEATGRFTIATRLMSSSFSK